MNKLMLALALSMPAAAAMAADLPRRVAPPVSAPIFAGIDAFASVSAGYNWGNLESFGSSTSANGLELSARGSFSAPISAGFGVQVDGQYERSAYSIFGTDLKKNTGEVAGHMFWRDSNRGLIGVIGQASSTETSFGLLSDRRYFIGAEGQYYLGNVTLYGQAAYQNANFGFPSFGFSNGIKADGFVGAAQLRYFITPDLMIAAKGGYENVSTSDLGGISLRHSAWLAGGKIENRFYGTPFSVFAEADYRAGDFNQLSGKENETRAQVGVKLNFGSNTLIERDRAGASLDPIRSLKAIVPFFGAP
jgi:hypothetical protein